jgi:hypothetical protein
LTCHLADVRSIHPAHEIVLRGFEAPSIRDLPFDGFFLPDRFIVATASRKRVASRTDREEV